MRDQVLNNLKLNTFENGTVVPGHDFEVNQGQISSYSPVDGSLIGNISVTSVKQTEDVIEVAQKAFETWRNVPAPKRGELIRRYANLIRKNKQNLANLLTLEVGKIETEALGEVQEMIDMADLAVGTSRQLFGLTIASERPGHRLMEQWHPLGVIGIITAFNFPMAAWAWNFLLAIVCGNSIVWKPSEKAPYSALACLKLFEEACESYRKEVGPIPKGLLCIVNGRKDIGEVLTNSKIIPLISATGSVRMGKEIAVNVASRLGKSLLELGGNNALILTPTADLELAIRAVTFAAVGTAGQRCTTLRRLIVHKSIKEKFLEKLKHVYETIKIGSPWEKDTLVGPLIDKEALEKYFHAIKEAEKDGGKVFNAGIADVKVGNGVYVKPVIIEIDKQTDIVKEETFAPILYVLEYEDFNDAIKMHNDVPQGLSSAVFTSDVKEAELFMSPSGSDCGIANVNIGTSGAEVGGGFGGEKETGGGRECGSDVWKNYMRRTSNTINYSNDLPLAQGVKFI